MGSSCTRDFRGSGAADHAKLHLESSSFHCNGPIQGVRPMTSTLGIDQTSPDISTTMAGLNATLLTPMVAIDMKSDTILVSPIAVSTDECITQAEDVASPVAQRLSMTTSAEDGVAEPEPVVDQAPSVAVQNPLEVPDMSAIILPAPPPFKRAPEPSGRRRPSRDIFDSSGFRSTTLSLGSSPFGTPHADDGVNIVRPRRTVLLPGAASFAVPTAPEDSAGISTDVFRRDSMVSSSCDSRPGGMSKSVSGTHIDLILFGHSTDIQPTPFGTPAHASSRPLTQPQADDQPQGEACSPSTPPVGDSSLMRRPQTQHQHETSMPLSLDSDFQALRTSEELDEEIPISPTETRLLAMRAHFAMERKRQVTKKRNNSQSSIRSDDSGIQSHLSPACSFAAPFATGDAAMTSTVTRRDSADSHKATNLTTNEVTANATPTEPVDNNMHVEEYEVHVAADEFDGIDSLFDGDEWLDAFGGDSLESERPPNCTRHRRYQRKKDGTLLLPLNLPPPIQCAFAAAVKQHRSAGTTPKGTDHVDDHSLTASHRAVSFLPSRGSLPNEAAPLFLSVVTTPASTESSSQPSSHPTFSSSSIRDAQSPCPSRSTTPLPDIRRSHSAQRARRKRLLHCRSPSSAADHMTALASVPSQQHDDAEVEAPTTAPSVLTYQTMITAASLPFITLD